MATRPGHSGLSRADAASERFFEKRARCAAVEAAAPGQAFRIQVMHSNEQDVYPVAQYLGKLCRMPVVVSVHFTMDRGYCEWAFAAARNPQRIFFVSAGSREACRPGIEGVVAGRPMARAAERARPGALRAGPTNAPASSGGTHGLEAAARHRRRVRASAPEAARTLVRAASQLDVPGLRVVVAGAAVKGDEAVRRRTACAPREPCSATGCCTLGHLDELRGFYNAPRHLREHQPGRGVQHQRVESLACGCPVVAYPSKSVDGQILPDGGEIVEQDNVHDLTAVLRDGCATLWRCMHAANWRASDGGGDTSTSASCREQLWRRIPQHARMIQLRDCRRAIAERQPARAAPPGSGMARRDGCGRATSSSAGHADHRHVIRNLEARRATQTGRSRPKPTIT